MLPATPAQNPHHRRHCRRRRRCPEESNDACGKPGDPVETDEPDGLYSYPPPSLPAWLIAKLRTQEDTTVRSFSVSRRSTESALHVSTARETDLRGRDENNLRQSTSVFGRERERKRHTDVRAVLLAGG